MGVMQLAEFCAPSYQGASVNYNQTMMNLYPERVPTMPGKTGYVMKSVHGLQLSGSTLGNTCVAAYRASNGRVYFIDSSGNLFVVTGAATYTNLGSVGTSTIGNNSIVDNGTQMLITSGGSRAGSVVTLSSGAITSITDTNYPSNNGGWCAYQDGRFIVGTLSTGIFQYSALNDAFSHRDDLIGGHRVEQNLFLGRQQKRHEAGQHPSREE